MRSNEETGGTPAKILVVEDSPTQARRLQYILEQQGHSVTVAGDGEEALEAAKRRKPTLIISDVVMPGMDGYELCRSVKANPGLSDVPVILVTTLSDPHDVIRGLESRADNFILKPYDERYLLGRVQYVLVNREMRQTEQPGMGLEIYFNGQRHFITADRLQILNLLLSTYDAAIQRNKQLTSVQEALQSTNSELQQLTHELEARVLERTAALEESNQALRESEESYRTVTETASDAMITVDDDSTIVFVNHAAAKTFGYAREEMLGERLVMLMPDVLRDLHLTSFKRYNETGQKHIAWEAVELTGLHKSGKEIPLEISFGEFIRGNKRYFTGIARDITDRKHMEEQLRQSQKMEAIGQLAGGVAHDFNNLLTVIVGYSQLIVGHSTTPDVRSGIEEIGRAAERASALTRQLLAFSRKQIMQPEVVDLNKIVTELHKFLARLIGEHIELDTHLEPALDLIRIDPSQMEQVIVNLAVNSRDAMPEGGKLTIETENLYLDEEYCLLHTEVQPGWYVRLAVSDTGAGMNETTKARLFEPFFTTKETGKGTGLGLSTVHGIVKQSGGQIWVYSEVGHGTTFKIYFPRAAVQADAERRERSESSASPGGSETILLVEDDESVRSLAAAVLMQNGYTLMETGDPKAALSMVAGHEGPIDLLITDVVMPGLSGRRLVGELSPLLPGMRVLYMSGYTDNAIVHHGVLDEGLAFLQKPFAPETLLRKVRDVLDSPAAD
jgi:PAS domain S-box-containing protein